MPKRWCQCKGCLACGKCGESCNMLYDLDAAPGLRCPACQAHATAQRNNRPSSSSRGYDGQYQHNKPIVIQQGRNGRPCIICGRPFTPNNKITVEHITPLRAGGSNELSNLGPAHAWCNTGWNRGKKQSKRT